MLTVSQPHFSTLLPLVTGSVVDAEARARTRTLYLPFGSIPMFPAVLAEGAFSLRAAEDGADAASAPACCALSVGATLAGDGSLSGYEVVPSFVKVTNRLTYDEADADIALGPEGCAHEDLQSIYQAARLRCAY
jgi:exoribonuclease R